MPFADFSAQRSQLPIILCACGVAVNHTGKSKPLGNENAIRLVTANRALIQKWMGREELVTQVRILSGALYLWEENLRAQQTTRNSTSSKQTKKHTKSS